MVDDDFYEEYKKRLEQELKPEEQQASAQPVLSYSDTYKQFKQEQTSQKQLTYEKLCNFSAKLLKLKISDKDKQKIQPAIELAHLSITPEGAYALGYLTTLLLILFTVPIGILLRNLYVIVGGALLAIIAAYYIPQMPNKILNSWRAKASNQIVTAVLYMVIYMEHTPNLEQAVYFTARHLPPPLSLDFMKVLYNVEVGTYSSISDSLQEYLKVWHDWSNEFIESVQILISSLHVRNEEQRLKTLDRAVNTILDGVHDNMLGYAHKLQSPIESLHMLGVVLPVMGLVMLPMIGAFMGESIKWWYLILLYNILLPIIVYALGKSVLQTRPAGASQQDVNLFMKQRKGRRKLAIGNVEITVSPTLTAVIIFLAIIATPLFYFYKTYTTLTGSELQTALNSVMSISMSILAVIAIGLSFGTYYYLSVSDLIKTRRETAKIEKEFASAVFQLGNRMEENVPVELAFAKVAEQMKDTPTAKMFRLIDSNLRSQGATLKQAIFSPKFGAINQYPSSMVKSVMNLLVEGAKKGSAIVAKSLITISKYLMEVKKVEERMKDLLADTLAGMQMQVKMFVPIIAGIVVGLAALTTNILLSLGQQLQNVQLGEADVPGGGVGSSLLNIFQLDAMLPAHIFQFIVGLYLIQIGFILSYLISGIVHGDDAIERNYLTGQNLFIGTIAYTLVALLTTLAFTGLTKSLSSLV